MDLHVRAIVERLDHRPFVRLERFAGELEPVVRIARSDLSYAVLRRGLAETTGA